MYFEDFPPHTGDQDIWSVSSGLPDHPGELIKTILVSSV